MTLTFPTRPRSFTKPGTPERATHCVCGPRSRMIDPHTGRCCKCGRHEDTVIRHTWHQRAQEIARKRKKAA